MRFNIVGSDNPREKVVDILLTQNLGGNIDILCDYMPICCISKDGIIRFYPHNKDAKEKMGFECYPNGEVKRESFENE